MVEEPKEKHTMTLMALILMIFTSVYGITNITKAFWLMGYASIFWYVLAALLFFIPYAFMLGEFGAAFKDYKGGIYSWMAESINPKYAFIGIFMWYTSNVIWMVNVGSGIWIPLSNLIFGEDTTQTWHFFGLNSVQILGILGVLLILGLTFISRHGLEKIKKFTNFGGTMVIIFNILVFGIGLIILIKNGHFEEPLTLQALFHSPNPNYQNILQVFSFIVFAIFAYGGLEVLAGVTDETKDPEKTFPKAIIISAIIIAVMYTIGIFLIGAFTNWKFAFTQFGNGEVTMGNVSYIMMNNMGYQMGLAFGMSQSASLVLGEWISRLMGLSMFISLCGAFFTIIFSPLKQLIEGTPKEIWPKKWTESKNGMPVYAMNIQAILVCVIILLVAFGGKSATQFFNILVAMTNVSMTIPYMFIAAAFWGFKKREDIEKPFEVYKKPWLWKSCVIIVVFVIGFANFFTIIEPAIEGDMAQTIWSIVGPVFFGIVAWWLYSRYEKKYPKQQDAIN